MQFAVRFCPILLDFQKSIAFLERLQDSLVCPSVKVTCKWPGVWSIGGITLAENSRSTQRKSYLSVLTHHKSHMDRPGTNPSLDGESPATNRLKHDKATKVKMNLHYTQSFSSYPTENRVCFVTKTHQLLLFMEIVFSVGNVRNTYIHCVGGRMESFLMSQQEMNVLTTNSSSFSNTVFFSVAL